jgi:hypothetical protein
MASSKQRTTFAKLNREQKVRERRVEKQMRKEARKLEAAEEQPVVHREVELDLDVAIGAIDPSGVRNKVS